MTLPFVPGVEIVGRTTTGRRILSTIFETGGVDVVLDSTGGPTMLAGLECLADFGRLVNYGACRPGDPPAS